MVICHAGSDENFAENSLLHCGKNFRSHVWTTMIILMEVYLNGSVFIPHLPKEKKIVVVRDSAKHYIEFIEKTPVMNMKKNETIAFITKHDIEILNPIPTNPVLLGNLAKKNLKNRMSLSGWLFQSTGVSKSMQILYHVRHLNFHVNQSSKVVCLIHKENIFNEIWVNYTNHVIKEQEKLRFTDHILDNVIELFIIRLC